MRSRQLCQPRYPFGLVLLGLAGCLLSVTCSWSPPGRGLAADTGQIAETATNGASSAKSSESSLQNLLQVSRRVYCGGEPLGEVSFSELEELGVETIVSVDGARPNVEAARRHGMQYVHIPIGYDGIDQHAGKSLARLVQDHQGTIYIHCHHGKHRGPAAAAIACIADGTADQETAVDILRRAGTGKHYAGLWRDVAGYQPPASTEELPPLVAVAQVGSLAEAMAKIDRAKDHLKLMSNQQWQPPQHHPDLVAVQQALLVKESFRETNRQLAQDDLADPKLLQWMRQAESVAEELQVALTKQDIQSANALFKTMQSQCQQCHSQYRN